MENKLEGDTNVNHRVSDIIFCLAAGKIVEILTPIIK
jgi:hypothetical protein